ncbi:hypothetical protein [Archangium minus]
MRSRSFSVLRRRCALPSASSVAIKKAIAAGGKQALEPMDPKAAQ